MRILLALLLLTAGNIARAQARGTADQGIRLQGYALGSYVRPDFNGALRNGGATVGANINVGRFAGRFEPSLDLRALGSGGRVSNQYLYGFGPRLVVNFDRVQPYAEFLIGDGIIHLNQPLDPNYTRDNCLATAFGGGTDIAVNRTWAIRAEVLSQHWQLSHRAPVFHPLAASVGVRYQFHFHGRGGPDL